MFLREKYVKCRDALNLTDTQVCLKTGISQSTLSDWLHGRSKTLGGDKAVALAKLFNVPLDTFIENIRKKDD